MTTSRAITIADLARLVTRRSADYMTSKWTIRLEFPASEPVSIHSWQADLLAAIPSAPVVPVVSGAAVEAAADEVKAHSGPLGDPDEGTLCNCGAVVAPVGEYGVRAWREHVAGAVLAAALPHLAAVPSATRDDVETITIPRPHVPHGPAGVSRDDSDADYLREAARDLEGFYKPFGSNLRATVVGLLRDAADAITPRTDR